MWTRTYLFLLLVRIYFAIAPSYIHPDENFQGPEVIVGRILGYAHHETWEFSANAPVRSIFPLWPVYALPMLVLKWMWAGLRTGDVPPEVTYYTLRLLMFILSFVLEDWAIQELVQPPRYRRLAATLVASSYVTWTYQTHTFSNSIETLAVLWSLVMIQRILSNKNRPSLLSSAILGAIVTFGIFNRITFPAFTALPLLLLVPHFLNHPTSLLISLASTATITLLAILADTHFYNPTYTLPFALTNPTITPLNSLLYNSSPSNLETHGLHPRYQHLIINLPLLVGPALLVLPTTLRSKLNTLPTLSFLSGLFFLSVIPHQEARFLLPLPALFLSSLRLPKSQRHACFWLAVWLGFNTVFGVLMGTYHQGGVVPGQIWLGQQNFTAGRGSGGGMREVLWWRTYTPPIHLLGTNSTISTVDLMGMPFDRMQERVQQALGDCGGVEGGRTVGLVAPWSSVEIEGWMAKSRENGLEMEELWRWNKHLNLDDMDFGDDGFWPTLGRVIGRRGLVIWALRRVCEGHAGRVLGGDW